MMGMCCERCHGAISVLFNHGVYSQEPGHRIGHWMCLFLQPKDEVPRRWAEAAAGITGPTVLQ